MPSRYINTRTRRDKSGVVVYSTTLYPSIDIEDEDRFIYPGFGQRLDSLAYEHYGDVSLWWVIAKANNLTGKLVPSPSVEIRIPSNITKILEDFNNLNT